MRQQQQQQQQINKEKNIKRNKSQQQQQQKWLSCVAETCVLYVPLFLDYRLNSDRYPHSYNVHGIYIINHTSRKSVAAFAWRSCDLFVD